MKRFIVILLSCLVFLNGSADVLWWRVTDTTRRVVQEYVQETSKDSDGNIILITNDDGTPKMVWKDKHDEQGNTVYEVTGHAYVDSERLSSFVEPYAWNEDGYSGFDVGARVRVNFANGTSTILPIVDSEVNYAALGDGIDDGTGIVSTGDWGTQSQLPQSELLQEVMFLIELGKLTYNEVLDNYEFTNLLAESDPYSYQQLLEHYIYEQGTLSPPTEGQWTPMNYHSVPEPSTSILCLLGVSLLMLRRKHHEKLKFTKVKIVKHVDDVSYNENIPFNIDKVRAAYKRISDALKYFSE